MDFLYISRLKFYRCSDGISQLELSKILRITRQTVVLLESGKTRPTLLIAHTIAKYFAVPIEDIFTFKDL